MLYIVKNCLITKTYDGLSCMNIYDEIIKIIPFVSEECP